jgi:hypothetical protein
MPLRPVHRLDEPTGLSLSMVASPQCRFRFARRSHCSASATSAANFRMARHPAAIRTGTSTTWLHRWAMYSRMSSGPSWSVERWKYCANYTPMSSEHGCERLSHDQPIVFSRP